MILLENAWNNLKRKDTKFREKLTSSVVNYLNSHTSYRLEAGAEYKFKQGSISACRLASLDEDIYLISDSLHLLIARRDEQGAYKLLIIEKMCDLQVLQKGKSVYCNHILVLMILYRTAAGSKLSLITRQRLWR